jgi:hypothetical protein
MRCDMSVPVGKPNEKGWRKWRCARSGCSKRTKWTPHAGEMIHFTCNGWPRPDELGEWVELFLSAAYITPRTLHLFIRRLGLVERIGCGCYSRKKWLNTFGGRLSQRTDWIGCFLFRLLVRRAPTDPSSAPDKWRPDVPRRRRPEVPVIVSSRPADSRSSSSLRP